MKKQFALSAIILTTALAGGLATPDPTIACPFARNQGTPITQNNPNSPFPLVTKKFDPYMMLGVAATLGLLATGWVVASRLNQGFTNV